MNGNSQGSEVVGRSKSVFFPVHSSTLMTEDRQADGAVVVICPRLLKTLC